MQMLYSILMGFLRFAGLARFMAFGDRYLPPIIALTTDSHKSIF